MQNKIYEEVKAFKKKYPRTVAFRLKAHAKMIEKFVAPDEEVKYVFVAQKNFKSYEIINTNIVVLTNKRILIGTKRLIFGYFYKMITAEMFNDLTVKNGIIWGKIIIDTVKERVILSNIDPNALAEIESNVAMTMIEEKKKYGIKEREEISSDAK